MILFALNSTKITTQKSGQTLARLWRTDVNIRQQKMELIINKNRKTFGCKSNMRGSALKWSCGPPAYSNIRRPPTPATILSSCAVDGAY